MYNKKVMELFQNPENCGLLHGADIATVVNHEQFGDVIKFYIRLDENGVIEDASFKAFGSPALIACTSIIASLVKGKTPNEAMEITNEDIMAEIETLPESKLYCLDFARYAVIQTVQEYFDKLRKEEKRQNKIDKIAMLEEQKIEASDDKSKEIEDVETLEINQLVEDVETNIDDEDIEQNTDYIDEMLDNENIQANADESNLFDEFDDDEFDDYDEDIDDEIVGDGVEDLYNKIFNYNAEEKTQKQNKEIKLVDNADDSIFDE